MKEVNVSNQDSEAIRLECIKIAHEIGTPSGKTPVEYAAELVAFVMAGTYTVTKKV